MIVCDKCASVIEEKLPEEPKPEAKDIESEDGSPKRSRYKKEPPKEEAPTKRASLVNLPYKRGVNCFERRDFDLCEQCKAFLNKALDKVAFEFITTK
ncbi:MAG: hypothetical protein IJ488_01560 [Clostridia bacterium]|nr:hypothetical protein [Clostridia bacterium]